MSDILDRSEQSSKPTQPIDGGPAFPISQSGDSWPFTFGMSLRDYFAAAAMSGYLATFIMDPHPAGRRFDEPTDDELAEKRARELARVAYRTADAMLAVRMGGQS